MASHMLPAMVRETRWYMVVALQKYMLLIG